MRWIYFCLSLLVSFGFYMAVGGYTAVMIQPLELLLITMTASLMLAAKFGGARTWKALVTGAESKDFIRAAVEFTLMSGALSVAFGAIITLGQFTQGAERMSHATAATLVGFVRTIFQCFYFRTFETLDDGGKQFASKATPQAVPIIAIGSVLLLAAGSVLALCFA